MGRRRSSELFIVALLAVAALLASCAASSPPPSTSTGAGAPGSIAIKNFSFDPANVEVKAGTKVTWTNGDSTRHTVTSDDGTFKSAPIDPGGSFDHTFPNAGTFKYHCSIHPSMVGQVTVK